MAHGGWYVGRLPNAAASNCVWWSTDGANWAPAAEHAGWSPRLGAAIVEFRGKMWILGGMEHDYDGDERSLKNDVWSSADGKHWMRETVAAGWSPRAYHGRQLVAIIAAMPLFQGDCAKLGKAV